MPRTITAEGKSYTFPDDATDAEISDALTLSTAAPDWSKVIKAIPGEAVRQGMSAIAGVQQAGGDVFNVPDWQAQAQMVKKELASERSVEVPQNMTIPQEGVLSGGASALNMVPALALTAPISAAAAPGAALKAGMSALTTIMGAQTGLQRYGDLRAAGFSPGRSALHGAFEGLVEKYTEYLPMKEFLGAGPLAREFINFMGKEMGGEQIATLLQDASAKLSDQPDMTLGDYVRDALVTAVATPVAGALQGGAAVAVKGLTGGETPPEANVPPVPSNTPPAVPPSNVTPPVVPPVESTIVPPGPTEMPPVGPPSPPTAPPSVSAPAPTQQQQARVPPSGIPQEIATMLQERGVEPSAIPVVTTREEYATMQEQYGPPNLIPMGGRVTGALPVMFVDDSQGGRPVGITLVEPFKLPSAAETPPPPPAVAEPSTVLSVEATTPLTIPVNSTSFAASEIVFPDIQAAALWKLGSLLNRLETSLSAPKQAQITAETEHVKDVLKLKSDNEAKQMATRYVYGVSLAGGKTTEGTFTAPAVPEALAMQAKHEQETVGKAAAGVKDGQVAFAQGLEVTPWLKTMQAYLQRWVKTFSPKMRVVVLSAPRDALSRAETMYYGGVHFIHAPRQGVGMVDRALGLYVLAHEFGHMIINQHLHDPQYSAIYDKLVEEYGKWIAAIPNMSAIQTARSGQSPIPLIGSDVAMVERGMDYMRAMGPETFTFDEWLADQMVRYMHTNRTHLEIEGERGFWKPLFDQLKVFFDKVVKVFAPSQTYSGWVESLREQDSSMAPTGPMPRVGIDRSTGREIHGKPGVNFGRLTTLLGSKLYGNPSDLPAVSAKEMIQNAFDAIKGLMETGGLKEGKLDIKINADDRTISVQDNGAGMPPEVLATQFLQLAGTHKTSTRASGGLGIAKGLFLYGNDRIMVTTVNGNTKSFLDTTGEALMAAADGQAEPVKIHMEDTTEPSGTTVTVVVPKEFVDPSTGETEQIEFSRYMDIPVLVYSPMLENVVVTRNRVVLDIGANFPWKDYGHFAKIAFNWGDADVYVGKKEEATWSSNMHVLSNGLWQFSDSIQKNPFESFGENAPRQFYINVIPKVAADQAGYPFDLNRQRFSTSAAGDITALKSYLSMVYKKQETAEQASGFGTIAYIDRDGHMFGHGNLTPPMTEKTAESMLTITENDDVRVENGRLFVNNRLIPMLTKEDMKTAADTLSEFVIDQARVDPKRVMLHDNVDVHNPQNVKEGLPTLSLTSTMIDEFGPKFLEFMHQIGATFQNVVASFQFRSGYEKLGTLAVGISFDKEYRGVHSKVPFHGIFVNPAAFRYTDVVEASTALWLTMVHEITHLPVMAHNADFVSLLQGNIAFLEGSGQGPQQREALAKTLAENAHILTVLSEKFDDKNSKPRGKHLPDVVYDLSGSRGDTDVVGTGQRASGTAGVYERTETFSRDPSLGPIPENSVGGDSVQLVGSSPAVRYRALARAVEETGNRIAARAGVPELPATFVRFQGFLQNVLQLNQLAKLLPSVEGLQAYRVAMRALHAFKAKLFEGPNDRIHEWHKLAWKQAQAVEQALHDERMQGEHWTELRQTEIEDNRGGKRKVWVHTPNAGFDALMASKRITEEGKRLFLGIKNDYLSTLQAMEEVTSKNVKETFAGNEMVQTQRLLALEVEMKTLRESPFLPDMRFGRYSVNVRAGHNETIDGREIKKGELVYWEKFENKRQRDRRFSELKKQLAGHNVSASYDSETVSALRGLPASVLQTVTEALNSMEETKLSEDQMNALEDVAFDQTAAGKFAKYLHTPSRHLAGASKDMRRAYAAYHWKTANAIAKLTYFKQLTSALNRVNADARTIRVAGGMSDSYDKLHEHLRKNLQYIMNPQHEFEQLRAFVSLWYLWGSAKTAAMNMMSVPVLTYPYLAARFGDLQATSAMMKAMKDVVQYWRDPTKLSLDRQRVLKQGFADGTYDQSFASMLASVSDGGVAFEKILPTFPFMGEGNTTNVVRRAVWQITAMGMAPFRVVEQFNRMITGLAAYDLQSAKLGRTLSQGDTEAYDFSRDAVDYTQNEYNAWNRPPLLQGKKSIFLLFFSFVQNMSFMMFGGDKSWWRAMMILAAMAGIQGLPGMDNLIDVMNWAWRKVSGQHIDLRNEARDVAKELGMNPDFVMHGISHNWLGMGWDTSTSIGQGRVIPGTDAIFGSGKFEQRFLSAAGEVGGPVGSLMISFLQALADDNSNALAKWDRALPPVMRNAERAWNAYEMDVWANARGAPLANDPTAMEVLGQTLGFSPTRKTERQEELRNVRDIASYYSDRRTNLLEAMFNARKTHDQSTIAEARKEIERYNDGVPEPSLKINNADIAKSMKTRERMDKETLLFESPTKRYREIYRYIDGLY
jgi:Histidine kinase-, DNA gyrase B-, and HSP90-like ATPase